VEVDKNYALVISTNGGLWRYIIGDTVKFSNLKPYRFTVSGRTKHFINVFGEEVIIENADQAINAACEQTNAHVKDYTACPIFMEAGNQGGHEWLIEFSTPPEDLNAFSVILDNTLKAINSDYEAKRSSDLSLNFPIVHQAEKGTFDEWLKKKGKLGGQHKVPRLSNNRNIFEEIIALQDLGTNLEKSPSV
jgi:hypothetical protein